MKKIIALLMAMAMVLGLVACGGSGEGPTAPPVATEAPAADAPAAAPAAGDFSARDDGVFRIGVYNYLSGLELGAEEDIAFQIALEKYGDGKTINGEPVEFVIYDTLNDPSEAIVGVQYLIGQNCDAVLGSFQSADVVGCYPYLEEAKVFNMFAGTSGSIVTPDQVYSFRGAFNANKTASAYAQAMVDFGYENVAVFFGQDEASMSNWNDACKAAFDAAGLKIVAEETGTHNDTDYSAQCMKIVAAKPDVVYVVCSGAGQNFVKQLREYGYNGIIMNKDEWMTSHVSSVGEENSNYLMSMVSYTTYKTLDAAKASGASPNVIAFLEEYAAKTDGKMPTLGITYRMYDSMLILLEAAKRAGCNYDSDKLAEACLTINDLQGCMGTVDFTQGDREPANEFQAVIYVDGGSKSVEIWKEAGGYEAYKAATGREK